MLIEQKNSKKQGDVGMAVAISYFAIKGDTVSVPLTDSQAYDLLVDDGTSIYRVQVKTVYYKKPGKKNYEVELRTHGGNRSGTGKVKHFDHTVVDILFVLTENMVQYSIPVEKFSNISTLTLSKDYDKYIVSKHAGTVMTVNYGRL